jgi:hypothetical protein
MLKDLAGKIVHDFSFEVRVSEEPKGNVGSREHFSNVISDVLQFDPKLKRRHDCESRHRKSIGSHKPDYVTRSDDSAGEHGIVVIGEVKGIEDADREFPDEDVGQILDFLQELMTKQGWRRWAYGFLTDGIRFEFLHEAPKTKFPSHDHRCTRKDQHGHTCRTC